MKPGQGEDLPPGKGGMEKKTWGGGLGPTVVDRGIENNAHEETETIIGEGGKSRGQ